MIVVLTSHPLNQVLQRPKVLGRLTKWAIELGEFEVCFVPQTVIKSYALVDFVAKFTYPIAIMKSQFDKP